MRHLHPTVFLSITLLPLSCLAQATDVDTTPLKITTTPAFPNLQWAGWQRVDDKGQITEFRPVVLTHAGDGTNRIFLATQRGVIHVFRNSQRAQSSQVFLDLRAQVRQFDPDEFEEGFLGLAFHPDYAKNGEFFICYTSASEPHTSIFARRRVSQDDPQRADPDFEEELFRVPQPYWNHNGGCMIFGPDGYLYISLGDGGKAADPHGHGQNTQTLLGTICRIDVDRRAGGKNYAIPPDNPFADNPQAGRPEIYAFGLRNVWGMSFDPETGLFWAADVGQNMWEEIDVIERGGNYGWNPREGFHGFPSEDSPSKPQFIDPVWEYDHEAGKSITGGFVYRGKSLPQLLGAYVYADFVSGKVWALRYDAETQQVTANQPIASPTLPITAFGVDADNELYCLALSASGQGIYRFQAE